jgi:hypothetical protein
MRGAMSEIEINDQSSNHHYRTELPNVIFEIGLKANELALYCAIKKSAGDSGYCTKSTKTLCAEAGVGERNFGKLKQALSQQFQIINKPLIIVKKRNSDFGDPDTDLITIIDVWPENYRYFMNEDGGGAKLQVPGAKMQGGVVQNCGGGGAKLRVKQQPFKKNPSKKTTTTNKLKSSSSFSQEVEIAAQRAFDFVKVRAEKQPDEKWNIDLLTLKKHFHLFGVDYTADQFKYLIERMDKYNKNKSKVGNKMEEVSDPKVYFKRSCSENWANSLHTKENE